MQISPFNTLYVVFSLIRLQYNWISSKTKRQFLFKMYSVGFTSLVEVPLKERNDATRQHGHGKRRWGLFHVSGSNWFEWNVFFIRRNVRSTMKFQISLVPTMSTMNWCGGNAAAKEGAKAVPEIIHRMQWKQYFCFGVNTVCGSRTNNRNKSYLANPLCLIVIYAQRTLHCDDTRSEGGHDEHSRRFSISGPWTRIN